MAQQLLFMLLCIIIASNESANVVAQNIVGTTNIYQDGSIIRFTLPAPPVLTNANILVHLVLVEEIVGERKGDNTKSVHECTYVSHEIDGAGTLVTYTYSTPVLISSSTVGSKRQRDDTREVRYLRVSVNPLGNILFQQEIVVVDPTFRGRSTFMFPGSPNEFRIEGANLLLDAVNTAHVTVGGDNCIIVEHTATLIRCTMTYTTVGQKDVSVIYSVSTYTLTPITYYALPSLVTPMNNQRYNALIDNRLEIKMTNNLLPTTVVVLVTVGGHPCTGPVNTATSITCDFASSVIPGLSGPKAVQVTYNGIPSAGSQDIKFYDIQGDLVGNKEITVDGTNMDSQTTVALVNTVTGSGGPVIITLPCTVLPIAPSDNIQQIKFLTPSYITGVPGTEFKIVLTMYSRPFTPPSTFKYVYPTLSTTTRSFQVLNQDGASPTHSANFHFDAILNHLSFTLDSVATGTHTIVLGVRSVIGNNPPEDYPLPNIQIISKNPTINIADDNQLRSYFLDDPSASNVVVECIDFPVNMPFRIIVGGATALTCDHTSVTTSPAIITCHGVPPRNVNQLPGATLAIEYVFAPSISTEVRYTYTAKTYLYQGPSMTPTRTSTSSIITLDDSKFVANGGRYLDRLSAIRFNGATPQELPVDMYVTLRGPGGSVRRVFANNLQHDVTTNTLSMYIERSTLDLVDGQISVTMTGAQRTVDPLPAGLISIVYLMKNGKLPTNYNSVEPNVNKLPSAIQVPGVVTSSVLPSPGVTPSVTFTMTNLIVLREPPSLVVMYPNTGYMDDFYSSDSSSRATYTTVVPARWTIARQSVPVITTPRREMVRVSMLVTGVVVSHDNSALPEYTVDNFNLITSGVDLYDTRLSGCLITDPISIQCPLPPSPTPQGGVSSIQCQIANDWYDCSTVPTINYDGPYIVSHPRFGKRIEAGAIVIDYNNGLLTTTTGTPTLRIFKRQLLPNGEELVDLLTSACTAPAVIGATTNLRIICQRSDAIERGEYIVRITVNSIHTVDRSIYSVYGVSCISSPHQGVQPQVSWWLIFKLGKVTTKVDQELGNSYLYTDERMDDFTMKNHMIPPFVPAVGGTNPNFVGYNPATPNALPPNLNALAATYHQYRDEGVYYFTYNDQVGSFWASGNRNDGSSPKDGAHSKGFVLFEFVDGVAHAIHISHTNPNFPPKGMADIRDQATQMWMGNPACSQHFFCHVVDDFSVLVNHLIRTDVSITEHNLDNDNFKALHCRGVFCRIRYGLDRLTEPTIINNAGNLLLESKNIIVECTNAIQEVYNARLARMFAIQPNIQADILTEMTTINAAETIIAAYAKMGTTTAEFLQKSHINNDIAQENTRISTSKTTLATLLRNFNNANNLDFQVGELLNDRCHWSTPMVVRGMQRPEVTLRGYYFSKTTIDLPSNIIPPDSLLATQDSTLRDPALPWDIIIRSFKSTETDTKLIYGGIDIWEVVASQYLKRKIFVNSYHEGSQYPMFPVATVGQVGFIYLIRFRDINDNPINIGTETHWYKSVYTGKKQDHSKWAVDMFPTDDSSGNSNMFCVGGSNRHQNQDHRGGEMICLQSKRLAMTLRSWVRSYAYKENTPLPTAPNYFTSHFIESYEEGIKWSEQVQQTITLTNPDIPWTRPITVLLKSGENIDFGPALAPIQPIVNPNHPIPPFTINVIRTDTLERITANEQSLNLKPYVQALWTANNAPNVQMATYSTNDHIKVLYLAHDPTIGSICNVENGNDQTCDQSNARTVPLVYNPTTVNPPIPNQAQAANDPQIIANTRIYHVWMAWDSTAVAFGGISNTEFVLMSVINRFKEATPDAGVATRRHLIGVDSTMAQDVMYRRSDDNNIIVYRSLTPTTIQCRPQIVYYLTLQWMHTVDNTLDSTGTNGLDTGSWVNGVLLALSKHLFHEQIDTTQPLTYDFTCFNLAGFPTTLVPAPTNADNDLVKSTYLMWRWMTAVPALRMDTIRNNIALLHAPTMRDFFTQLRAVAGMNVLDEVELDIIYPPPIIVSNRDFRSSPKLQSHSVITSSLTPLEYLFTVPYTLDVDRLSSLSYLESQSLDKSLNSWVYDQSTPSTNQAIKTLLTSTATKSTAIKFIDEVIKDGSIINLCPNIDQSPPVYQVCDPMSIATITDYLLSLPLLPSSTVYNIDNSEEVRVIYTPAPVGHTSSIVPSSTSGLALMMVRGQLCDFALVTPQQSQSLESLLSLNLCNQAGSIITSVTPTGNSISITGIHMTVSTTVFIGSTQCQSTQLVSNRQLTCIPPPSQQPGSQHQITLSTGLAITQQQSFHYTYNCPTSISSITPNIGLATCGGDELTLQGINNFGTNVDVYIDGTICQVTSVSNTMIKCTTPAHVGSGLVVQVHVKGCPVLVSPLTVSYSSPTITQLIGTTNYITTTQKYRAGDQLLIRGTGFPSLTDINATSPRVYIGDKQYPIDMFNDQYIQLTVPQDLDANSEQFISIRTKNQVGQSPTVLPLDTPLLSFITPKVLPTIGGMIRIDGDGFGLKRSDVSVTLAGITLVDCQPYSYFVECVVPPGIGANLNVQMTVGSVTPRQGTSLTAINYATPVITSISVANGAMTVYGSNFVPKAVDPTSMSSILFNTGVVGTTGSIVTCASPMFISDKECRCLNSLPFTITEVAVTIATQKSPFFGVSSISGMIQGVVYIDSNYNNLYATGEETVPSVSMTLIAIPSGTTTTIVSDINGRYSAPNLLPGDYSIKIAQQNLNFVIPYQSTTFTVTANPITINFAVLTKSTLGCPGTVTYTLASGQTRALNLQYGVYDLDNYGVPLTGANPVLAFAPCSAIITSPDNVLTVSFAGRIDIQVYMDASLIGLPTTIKPANEMSVDASFVINGNSITKTMQTSILTGLATIDVPTDTLVTLLIHTQSTILYSALNYIPITLTPSNKNILVQCPIFTSIYSFQLSPVVFSDSQGSTLTLPIGKFGQQVLTNLKWLNRPTKFLAPSSVNVYLSNAGSVVTSLPLTGLVTIPSTISNGLNEIEVFNPNLFSTIPIISLSGQQVTFDNVFLSPLPQITFDSFTTLITCQYTGSSNMRITCPFPANYGTPKLKFFHLGQKFSSEYTIQYDRTFIDGKVFVDTNMDNVQQSSELGVTSQMSVVLKLKVPGQVVKNTKTDATGYYRIYDITPDTQYTISLDSNSLYSIPLQNIDVMANKASSYSVTQHISVIPVNKQQCSGTVSNRFISLNVQRGYYSLAAYGCNIQCRGTAFTHNLPTYCKVSAIDSSGGISITYGSTIDLKFYQDLNLDGKPSTTEYTPNIDLLHEYQLSFTLNSVAVIITSPSTTRTSLNSDIPPLVAVTLTVTKVAPRCTGTPQVCVSYWPSINGHSYSVLGATLTGYLPIIRTDKPHVTFYSAANLQGRSMTLPVGWWSYYFLIDVYGYNWNDVITSYSAAVNIAVATHVDGNSNVPPTLSQGTTSIINLSPVTSEIEIYQIDMIKDKVKTTGGQLTWNNPYQGTIIPTFSMAGSPLTCTTTTATTTCTIPPGIGIKPLSITWNTRALMVAHKIEYFAPQITAYSTAVSLGGTQIGFYGYNFIPKGVDPGNSTFTIDGYQCQVLAWEDDGVTCITSLSNFNINSITGTMRLSVANHPTYTQSFDYRTGARCQGLTTYNNAAGTGTPTVTGIATRTPYPSKIGYILNGNMCSTTMTISISEIRENMGYMYQTQLGFTGGRIFNMASFASYTIDTLTVASPKCDQGKGIYVSDGTQRIGPFIVGSYYLGNYNGNWNDRTTFVSVDLGCSVRAFIDVEQTSESITLRGNVSLEHSTKWSKQISFIVVSDLPTIPGVESPVALTPSKIEIERPSRGIQFGEASVWAQIIEITEVPASASRVAPTAALDQESLPYTTSSSGLQRVDQYAWNDDIPTTQPIMTATTTN
eukprot:gene2286-2593_t